MDGDINDITLGNGENLQVDTGTCMTRAPKRSVSNDSFLRDLLIDSLGTPSRSLPCPHCDFKCLNKSGLQTLIKWHSYRLCKFCGETVTAGKNTPPSTAIFNHHRSCVKNPDNHLAKTTINGCEVPKKSLPKKLTNCNKCFKDFKEPSRLKKHHQGGCKVICEHCKLEFRNNFRKRQHRCHKYINVPTK